MRHRTRLRLPALAIAGAFFLGACSGTDPGTSAEPPTPSTPTASSPSAVTSSPAAATVEKVLVFVVENHSLDQMQSDMPYIDRLARKYGYAAHYFALTHPSLPNYLAIAGGDTFGVHDDVAPSRHPLSGPSVFGAAVRAGSTAKLYAEAMTSPCQRENQGRYAVRHNPWAYFIDERAQCQRYDVPLTELATDITAGSLPAVGMVIPDLCNDAHDCALSVADSWMRQYVGEVLAGPDWQSGRLAVVITADEDDDHHDNQILTVVAHPSLDHAVVSTRLDHYSLARSYANVAQVPPLGRATHARSLLKAFGLTEG